MGWSLAFGEHDGMGDDGMPATDVPSLMSEFRSFGDGELIGAVDAMSEASVCILKRSRVSIHRFDTVGIGVGVGHCVGIGVWVFIGVCVAMAVGLHFGSALAIGLHCILDQRWRWDDSVIGVWKFHRNMGFRVGIGLGFLGWWIVSLFLPVLGYSYYG